jgi:hypothetical protein
MNGVEPLTDDERQYIEKLIQAIGRRSIRAKTCWRTAQLLMLYDQGEEKRLRYWECGRPIPHAWVTINDKVVDPTAEAAERKHKREWKTPGQNHHDYSRGVEIAWKAVSENMRRSGEHGPVVDWDAAFACACAEHGK